MSFSESSADDAEIVFKLVTEDGTCENLTNEYLLCVEKLTERFSKGDYLQWTPKKNVFTYTSEDLTSKIIFITDNFEDSAFKHLESINARILGPKCVINCFDENGIPHMRTPIFTCSMRGLHVTLSGFSSSERSRIGRLVNFMGGTYFTEDHLTEAVTHLVTNTVMSKKYEQSAVSNKQILKKEWVDYVWKQNQLSEGIFRATSNEMYDRFKVPPFYGLGITSTGLSEKTKNKIKTLIESNGGTYHSNFKSEIIHVLIAESNTATAESKKYLAAVKCNKECLTIDWILDSVHIGYAVPVDKYKIKVSAIRKPPTVSTPSKMNPPPVDANMSNMSAILATTSVDETFRSTRSFSRSSVSVTSVPQNAYKAILANINAQKSKKAGPFLDGCNVFLCGFTSVEKEKLYKILNSGSCTRYDEYNENVDHIIVGEPNAKELSMLSSIHNSCLLVTLEWLVDSIAQKQCAKETNYLFHLKNIVTSTMTSTATKENVSVHSSTSSKENVPSPASKKMIQSMTQKSLKKKLNFDDKKDKAVENEEASAGHELLAQYSQQQSDEEKSQLSLELTVHHNIFQGITFLIYGFVEDSMEELYELSKKEGAVLVDENYTSCIDYLIVPVDIFNIDMINVQYKNIVNEYWIEDCIAQEQVVVVKYYHHPIIHDVSLCPLKNITVVFTTYCDNEKNFLLQLAQILGANIKEAYARNDNALLICPKPEGAKYNGAIRWKQPIVSCEWILACYKTNRKEKLRPYLVGESIVPPDELNDDDDDDNVLDPSDFVIFTPRPQSTELHVNTNEVDNNRKVLKEKRKLLHVYDDFSKPETPILKHRRLSVLAGENNATPKTPDDDAFCRRIANEFPTPEREQAYQLFKKLKESETPNTKQRRLLMGTPKTPVIPDVDFSSPAMRKRDQAFWDKLPQPVTQVKPDTPFSEIRNKFWKHALGDQYMSPTQVLALYGMTQDTNGEQPASTSTGGAPPGAVVNPKTLQANFEANIESNVQLKRLSDFIEKNRNADKTPKKNVDDIPLTIPIAPTDDIQFSEDITAESNDLVGWKDPSEFLQTHHLQTRKAMQHKGTPKFAISCTDPEKKKLIQNQIVQLNGQFCDDTIKYDTNSTHLLCEVLNRGEKLFSTIAAGKWVLSLQYIEDSIEAGDFLNEEFYEWGNPKAIDNCPSVDDVTIPRAAYRWRQKLAQHYLKTKRRQGAFSEFNVILHLSQSKQESMKNLLEAGMGTVLDVSEPYSEYPDIKNITHFISDSKRHLSAADKHTLTKNKILCVGISFLSSYITSELVPNPRDFILWH